MYIGRLVEAGQFGHGHAPVRPHLETGGEADASEQSEQLKIVQDAVRVELAVRGRVPRVAVQVQHDVVVAIVAGEQAEGVEGAGQHLAGLVASIGQHDEPTLAAQRLLDRSLVDRRLEEREVDTVRNVFGVHTAGPGDILTPAAHRHRHVGDPQQFRPTLGQPPLGVGTVDRVIVDPAGTGGVKKGLNLRIGQKSHPPDIR